MLQKFIILLILSIFNQIYSAVFFVTNTNDAGPGSLRQAIIDANNNPGADNIFFNIPENSPFIISLVSPLDPLTEQVTIDGSTQPGFTNNPIIIIDGEFNVSNGLEINSGADNSEIKFLRLIRFSNTAILINNSNDNKINNNQIVGNNIGITLSGAENNIIAKNIISENTQSGILLEQSSNNIISQNNINLNLIGITLNQNSNNNSISANNTIIQNNGPGVKILSGIENSILTNSIFNNNGNGIDLSGVIPVSIKIISVFTNIVNNIQSIAIRGEIQGLSDTTYKAQFFVNSVNRNPITEGQTFIGELNDITTNTNGFASFIAVFNLSNILPQPSYLSATATRTEGEINFETSEFTPNILILTKSSALAIAIKAKYCSG